VALASGSNQQLPQRKKAKENAKQESAKQESKSKKRIQKERKNKNAKKKESKKRFTSRPSIASQRACLGCSFFLFLLVPFDRVDPPCHHYPHHLFLFCFPPALAPSSLPPLRARINRNVT
jgi:hypothetical protein